MTAVHISSSLWAPQRHGGVRRSEQIAQNLASLFAELPTLSCARITRTWRVRPAAVLRTAWRAFGLLLRGVLTLRGFMRYLSYGACVEQFLTTHKPVLVALELCPGVSMIAGDIVRRSGIPYVVFPHNLEFLVPNAQPDVTFRSFSGTYEIESLIYRQARKVLTISGFDTTILRCMGIDTWVWPSYPPAEEVVRLGRIRDSRQGGAAGRHEILVLGTAINPPTHAGVSTLLQAVCRSKTWTHHINVVGFGTDALDDGGSPHIDILGPVDNDTLEGLLVRCAFALVHQPPTTGFLTRLVDLNLAGVPVAVVGDYEQARNLQEFGIFFFDRLEAIDADRLTHATMTPFAPPAIDRLRAALLPHVESTAPHAEGLAAIRLDH
jgi:hypothetical protein